jgi:hypothetical protein
MMMEVVRTSETSVDNYFTQQYIPEGNSEHLSYVHLLKTLTQRYGATLYINTVQAEVISPSVLLTI